MSEQHRYVTSAELKSDIQEIKAELKEDIHDRPTTARVQVLLLLSILANQLIPALDLGPNPVRSGVSAVVRALPL